MRTKSTAADIRFAQNARIANAIADCVQGDDVPHPVFMQRIGSSWP